jgi:SAM-dependent methyltransferase
VRRNPLFHDGSRRTFVSDFDQRRWDGSHRAVEASPALEAARRTTITGALPDDVVATTIWPSWPLDRLADELALPSDGVLLDVACGVGDIGRWVARRSGATVLGVEPSPVGRAAAEASAAEGDRYVDGLFGALPVDDAAADAALIVDALQFAPDPVAALRDVARSVKPGGRIVVVAPMQVPDAGLRVVVREETPGWRDRCAAFRAAIRERQDDIRAELGDASIEMLLSIDQSGAPWHGLVVLEV